MNKRSTQPKARVRRRLRSVVLLSGLRRLQRDMRKLVRSRMHPEYRLGVHRYDCELICMLRNLRKQNTGLSGGAPRAVRSDPLLGREDRP